MDPILTAPLFGPLTEELTRLLRSLPADDWERPTTAGEWRVRDVVAHLVDGNLRRLSAERDGHAAPAPPQPIRRYDDLVAYLNTLNAHWIEATQRLSPRVLLDLLEESDRQVAAMVSAADPFAAATFPVAWAGQSESPQWLDHGRELTERWHHQDQIREAVGADPLASPRWLRPVLAISLLALPHAFADFAATEGTALVISADGPAGGVWTLARGPDRWRLSEAGRTDASARIRTTDLTLVRLLLHRLSAHDARTALEIEGDAAVAAPLIAARAVMV